MLRSRIASIPHSQPHADPGGHDYGVGWWQLVGVMAFGGPDRFGELIERGGDPWALFCLNAEFVLAPEQVLRRGQPLDQAVTNPGRPGLRTYYFRTAVLRRGPYRVETYTSMTCRSW